ncbi:MAG: dihydrofolate reductase, partial [Lactococcus sp.]|nr:dihydrofolate reductase [Lactococcus sp.]
LYIIGGAEMFQVFSQSLDRLYRTIVSGVFEGDTYFPDVIQFDHFSELSSTTHPKDQENKYGFTVKTYEKNK